MGVVQNSIDIQNIIAAGGDPEIAAKVQELEAKIGDDNSGIIKDIDDLQEANALIMTSVSSLKSVVGDNTSGLVKSVNDISVIVTPQLLTSADDLNDITDTGLYVTTTAPAHTPDGRSYYSMLVIEHLPSDLTQIIFCSNNIYTRKFTGVPATWGAWTKFSGTTLS